MIVKMSLMELNILKTDYLHHRELVKKEKSVTPFAFLLHDREI